MIRREKLPGEFFTQTRAMLTCDHDAAKRDAIVLEGNIDVLKPSDLYDHLIVLVLTCIGAGLGWAAGQWAAAFGGLVGVVISVATTAAMAGAGAAVGAAVVSNYHLDGVMMRYLLKRAMQKIGQMILFNIECALQFESPRP